MHLPATRGSPISSSPTGFCMKIDGSCDGGEHRIVVLAQSRLAEQLITEGVPFLPRRMPPTLVRSRLLSPILAVLSLFPSSKGFDRVNAFHFKAYSYMHNPHKGRVNVTSAKARNEEFKGKKMKAKAKAKSSKERVSSTRRPNEYILSLHLFSPTLTNSHHQSASPLTITQRPLRNCMHHLDIDP
jgi:hypothetical protein